METQPLTSNRLDFDDAVEAIEYYFQQGWTDGLPVVPPTPDRVQQFLNYVGLTPSEILGMEPTRGRVITAEKVAINAVMAGCLPEYFPVVLAAIDAICEPRFNLHAITASTMGAAVLMVVNGPIAKDLGINPLWLTASMSVAFASSIVLSLWASFLITAREPATFLVNEASLLRGVIRGVAVLCFLCGAVMFMRLGGPATSMALSLSMLLGAFVCAAELGYFRRFARRIPNPKLARQTTHAIWGILICAVLITIDTITARIAGGFNPGRIGDPGLLEFAATLAHLGAFFYFVRYFYLLAAYRRAFRKAAAQSRDR